MANNIEVTAGTGTTLKTTDNAGVHTPHHAVDSSALPSGASTSAKQDDAITQETAINTVLGVKGDAKSTATDTTAITAMSVWKQISASVQAIASAIAGTLTVATHAVTQSGTWTVTAVTDITNDVTVVNDGTFAVQDSAVADAIAGTVVHGDAESGNQSAIGGMATTSLAGLTLVTNGQRTRFHAGTDGVPIYRPHCNLEDVVSPDPVTCASGAEASVVGAQGAGVKFYLLSATISNKGSTGGDLSLTEGTGGNERCNIPFSADGAIYNPPLPIPFAANTAVYANPTGSDDIVVTLVGFKSKI